MRKELLSVNNHWLEYDGGLGWNRGRGCNRGMGCIVGWDGIVGWDAIPAFQPLMLGLHPSLRRIPAYDSLPIVRGVV